jgi:hypothetical protein
VLVPVTVVGSVTMAIVQIVGVVAVGDGLVAAGVAVAV